MPEYIASGSHLFKDERYRFLILPRYKYDLHSIMRVNKRLDQKNILVVACQILDILQHLHGQGYVHSDIKARNLMIGSPADSRHLTAHNGDSTGKGGAASTSSSASSTITTTGSSKMSSLRSGGGGGGGSSTVEFGGSNPVRSCRSSGNNDLKHYHDLISSHYLRPHRNINYAVDDSDDADSLRSIRMLRGQRAGNGSGGVYDSNSNIMEETSNDGTSTSVMSNSSSSGISSIMNNNNNNKGGRRMTSRQNGAATGLKQQQQGKKGTALNRGRNRIISDSNEERGE